MDKPGLVGVKDAGVEDTIEFEGDVVGGDGALTRDLEGVFLERLDVGDAVDEGDENSQTGFENAVELSHALNDPCCLLRNESDDGVGGERRPLEVGGRDAGAGAEC